MIPSRRLTPVAGALLSASILLTVVAPVSTAQPPIDTPFGERIDVVLVEVEAVVVDRQGRRVAGLGRDAFRLLVDGEPVEIAIFEEIRAGAVVPSAVPEAAATTERPAAARPTAPPTASPRAATRYLVFVDQYFGSAGGRIRVLERLRGDLALVPAGDPVAVVAWNGRRLEVLAPWTTDRTELDRALERAAASRGPSAEVERRRAVDPEQVRRILGDQLAATYRAVTAALMGFGGGSGRSVALLVSGGWPFDPGGGSGFRSLLTPDHRGMIRRLAEVANSAGFTLYPIDAPGAQAGLTVSADIAGLDDVPGVGLQPLPVEEDGSDGARFREIDEPVPDRMERGFEQSWAEFDAESTLLLLAAETGGLALINSQRESALSQVVTDLSTFYRLGFYHSSRADGAVRRIEVALDRDGLEVRSRRSFADLTTATRAQVALEQALLLGVAADAEALAVRLGEPRPSGRRQMQVPFEIEIPMGEVTVRPARRGRIATSLELHVAVEDEEGRRNVVATLPIEIETVAAAVGGHVVWEGAVTLRRQGHEVLFALSDAASGRVFIGRDGVAGP